MSNIKYYIVNRAENIRKVCKNINSLKINSSGEVRNDKSMLLDSSYLIFAVCDEKIIGYVSIIKEEMADNNLFVNLIVVDYDYQHMHIGTNMLSLALEIASKYGSSLTALVSDNNYNSRKLFLKHGFSELSRDNHGYIKYINDNPCVSLDVPYETEIDETVGEFSNDLDNASSIAARKKELFNIINYSDKSDPDDNQKVNAAISEWRQLMDLKKEDNNFTNLKPF